MILVSICCLTYNHEKYIAQCLDGLLSQQCDFEFEILIHDDASTDNTQNIIKEFQKKYPSIIKPILQEKNQFSQNIRSLSARFNFPRAQGKYIAMCEGDDFWCDPGKLKRQVELLENNPEFILSAENAYVLKDSGKIEIFALKPTRLVNEFDIVKSRQFTTASILFRNNFNYNELINDYPAGDTILYLYLSKLGLIHYNNVISSVYRRGSHGITEKLVTDKYYDQLIKFYECHNVMTGYKYSAFLMKKIKNVRKIRKESFFDKVVRKIYYTLLGQNNAFYDIEFNSNFEKLLLIISNLKTVKKQIKNASSICSKF